MKLKAQAARSLIVCIALLWVFNCCKPLAISIPDTQALPTDSADEISIGSGNKLAQRFNVITEGHVNKAVSATIQAPVNRSKHYRTAASGQESPLEIGDKALVPVEERFERNAKTRARPWNRPALWIVLAGMLGVGGLVVARDRARRLAQWASANPWKARITIAGIQVGVGAGALLAGSSLATEGIRISDAVFPIATAAFAATALLYPDSFLQLPFLRRSFLRAKVHDATLFTAGTIMMMCVGNQSVPNPGLSRTLLENLPDKQFTFRPPVDADSAYDPLQIPDHNQQEPPKRKGKGWLVLLAVLVFAGLTYLLAALACSISCGGAEALAAIVGIGGEALLIALLVTTIRGIYGKNRKMKKTLIPVEPQEAALYPGLK